MRRHPGPRLLETPSQILGFEIPEILFLTFEMSLLSFLFAESSYRSLIAWSVTGLTALTLVFLKRGRPRGYTQTLVKALGYSQGISRSSELPESSLNRIKTQRRPQK